MSYEAKDETKVEVEAKVDTVVDKVDTKVNTDTNDWRTSIPEEYRSYITDDITDVGTLAKQFAERGKFLGNSIRIPGEDASPEARKDFVEKIKKHAPNLITRPDSTDAEATAAFWEMAGVPKDHNSYTVTDTPEGVNPDWIKELKPLAHKYGLTNAGFDKYVKDQFAIQKATADQNAKLQTESLNKLRTEWGSATDAKIADIQKFSTQMGFPKGFTEALSKGQVSGEWLKTVDNIIKQFGGMKEGSEAIFQKGSNIPDTPAEIEMKIAEIEGNPAYRKRNDPMHNSLVSKRIALLKDLGKVKGQK